MKNDTYQYPLNFDWTTEEIIVVMKFYENIESVYEKEILRENLMESYRAFKQIVPSQAEEKQLDKQFEKATTYSIYKAMKKCKEAENGTKIYIKDEIAKG